MNAPLPVAVPDSEQSSWGALRLQACNAADYVPLLHQLAELRGAAYAEVSLEARQILIVLQQPSMRQRYTEIEVALRTAGRAAEVKLDSDKAGGSGSSSSDGSTQDVLSALVDAPKLTLDMVTAFFGDDDATIRINALQVYVRRLYRSYTLKWMRLHDRGSSGGRGIVAAQWLFNATEDAARPLGMHPSDSFDNLAGLNTSPLQQQQQQQGTPQAMADKMSLSVGRTSASSPKLYPMGTARMGVMAVFEDMTDLSANWEQLLLLLRDGAATEEAQHGFAAASGDKRTTPRMSPPSSPGGVALQFGGARGSGPIVNVLHVVLLAHTTSAAAAAAFDTGSGAGATAGAGAGSSAGAGGAGDGSGPTPLRRRARSDSGIMTFAEVEMDAEEYETNTIDQLTEFLRQRRVQMEEAGVRRVTFSLPSLKSGTNTDGTTGSFIMRSGSTPASASLTGKKLAALPKAASYRRRAGSDQSSTDTRAATASLMAIPRLYTFRHVAGYREDALVRHMEPPMAGHLELKRLANFRIKLVPTPNRSVHVYEAVPRGSGGGGSGGGGGRGSGSSSRRRGRFSGPRKRFFVRTIVRQTDRIEGLGDVYEQYPGPERMFVEALNALNVAMGDALKDTSLPVGNNHIFLNVLPVAYVKPEYVERVIQRLARRYADRLRSLRVSQVEFKVAAQFTATSPRVPVRLISSNPTGYVLRVDCYAEVRDPVTMQGVFACINGPDNFRVAGLDSGAAEAALSRLGTSLLSAELDGKPVTTPYPISSPFERERGLAAAMTDTLYVYDFLELFQRALEIEWQRFSAANPSSSGRRPTRLVKALELDLRPRQPKSRGSSDSESNDASGGGGGAGGSSSGGASAGGDDASGAAPRGLTRTRTGELQSNEFGAFPRASPKPQSSATQSPRLGSPPLGSRSASGASSASTLGAGVEDEEDEELVVVDRPLGRNRIGMVAWHITLYTPECPDGREIVVIANDITHKVTNRVAAASTVHE